jgi:hypothetical protein
MARRDLTIRERWVAGRVRRRLLRTLGSFDYSGARIGRFHRSYSRILRAEDALLAYDRETMVGLSWSLYRSLLSYRVLIDSATQIVLGSEGLVPRPAHPDAELPVALFREWWDRTSVDHRSLGTGVDLQEWTLRSVFLSGDHGLLLTDDHRIQSIPAIRLRPNPNKIDPRLRDGVELDETGRIVRYHVSPYLPDGTVSFEATPVDPAHFRLVSSRRTNEETRGYPILQAGFERLAQVEDAIHATTLAQAVAAMFALVVYSSNPQAAGKLLRRVSRLRRSGGADEDYTEAEGLAPVDFGSILHADGAARVETIQANHPGSNFQALIDLITSLSAAGLGMPAQVVLANMRGVNFSQAKMLEFFARRGAAPWRRSLRVGMLHPIYERWLRWAMIEGKLPAITPTMERVVFADPPRWEVDPSRDTVAHERAAKNNTTTISELIRNEGRDPEVVFRERAAELDRMRDLGIAPPLDPGAVRDDDRIDLASVDPEELREAIEDAGRPELAELLSGDE